MSETIFHLDTSGKLTELNESSYISEDLLQQLLADYPNLISGSQINFERPRRWLLISREVRVPDEKDASGRWSLDHLFIDQDGIPTLVEVKRSTDTRIRREVVGQILDYAANAVSYWTIEEIITQFEAQCKKANKDDILELQDFLQEENEPHTFWELTKTNLKAGKIRMLIIADIIPKELQRIIEFLNEQMSPAEILGVEIKQFIGDGNIKTLVPRVIGQTAAADNIKGVNKTKETSWNEETFFQDLLTQRGEHELNVISKLFKWLKPRMSRFWYGAGKTASMLPILDDAGLNVYPFRIWSTGSVVVLFQYLKHLPPFDEDQRRVELVDKLNTINGINISKDKISGKPTFPINSLLDDGEYEKFIHIIEWIINEIKNQIHKR